MTERFKKRRGLRVFLVDDHAVVRTGYRLLLETAPDIEVIAELASGEEAHQKVTELQPDVVIMDLSMPGIGGLEAVRRIKCKSEKVKVLIFTMHDNVTFVEHALNAGASGYITKNSAPNILVKAVRKIAAGERYIEANLEEKIAMRQNQTSPFSNLSKREFQIFCMLAEGQTSPEIAEDLSLSIKTVANHQTQIKEKLGLNSTGDLIRLAISNGIIKL